MTEDGYLKAAKVFDNKTREFLIVRAYLTEEGKAALDRASSEQPSNQDEETFQSNPEVDVNKSLADDAAAILKSLDVLKEFVDQLPDGRRELAIVYLEDLQAEIKIVYRRKPQRIKAYFLAVLSIIFPIVQQLDNAPSFLECIKFLSKKLNVPVKLPLI